MSLTNLSSFRQKVENQYKIGALLNNKKEREVCRQSHKHTQKKSVGTQTFLLFKILSRSRLMCATF